MNAVFLGQAMPFEHMVLCTLKKLIIFHTFLWKLRKNFVSPGKGIMDINNKGRIFLEKKHKNVLKLSNKKWSGI
jgi:hypothetical protein